ncbi:MAG: hypothetical protein QM831_28980 [Kofleriaceae bacterium]
MRSLGVVVLVAACGDQAAGPHGVGGGDGAVDAAGPTFTQTAYIKSSAPLHDAHFGMLGLSGDGTVLVGGEDGTVTVYRRDPSWRVDTALTPDPAPVDYGPRVAISEDGSTVAVTADSTIYVFRASGATWTQDARLVEPGADREIDGLSVSADGTLLVASVRDTATDAFIVSTYERGDGSWPRSQPIAGIDQQFGLGSHLVLSPEGDALAVESGTPTVPIGVTIFTRDAGAWTRHVDLPGGTLTGHDGTGIACSSHCKTVAIGNAEDDGPVPDPNPMPGKGKVDIFDGDGTTWPTTPTATIVANDGANGDTFGEAVAISKDGATIVVGASKKALYSGGAYAFRRTGAAWAQVMALKASNAETTDIFGHQVAISNDGTTIAVAAPYEASASSGVGGNQADNSAPYAGAIYVFQGTY